jgi:YYY domain-containing protein
VPGDWIPSRFIWWWRASRVIHDCTPAGLATGDCNPPNNWEVIDEFPFFSFLLGDVHPHVLALPFVLLAIGLALNLILSRSSFSESQLLVSNLKPPISNLITQAFGGWPQFALYAICLGALGFLNTWDFPIYLFVVTLAFVLWRLRSDLSPERPAGWMIEAVAVALGLGLLGGILYLPFYLGFQSQAGGILPNLFNPTRLPQFLVFFGPFVFVIISFLAVLRGEGLAFNWRRLPGVLAFTVVAPVLAMLVIAGALAISPSARGWVEGLLNNPDVQTFLGGDTTLGSLAITVARIRLGNPWTFLFLAGLLAWVLALVNLQSPWPGTQGGPISRLRLPAADAFALILIGVGLLLPLAVEFVYLRDLFGYRINTVFKFYFQAWVLLALASGYGVSVVADRLRGAGGLVWRLGLLLLILAGLVYPILAIPDKAGGFREKPTLDGMAWLEGAYPDDYAAIRWLQANASDGSVILEAANGSYSYYGRVSALTGLPTVLGWDFHECQWRGNCDESSARMPEIDIIYNTVDLTQTLTLLDKYDITYVYVGPLERQRYNPAGLVKFGQVMELVYQQGNVTIYQGRGGIASQ